jgi:hypothetical protein
VVCPRRAGPAKFSESFPNLFTESTLPDPLPREIVSHRRSAVSAQEGYMSRLAFTYGPIVAAFALLQSASAVAHHSFAMFDFQRNVTLRGTVRQFQWSNPHVFIDVLSESDSTIWSIEMSSPSHLVRNGWKPTSLKAGDRITLMIHPLRDGRNGGTYVLATRDDGQPVVQAPAAAVVSR